MSGGLQAAAAATAAGLVGGGRAGTAGLGDERHLLTAAHVLPRRDDGGHGPGKPVEVLFPSGPAPDRRLPVTRVPLSVEGEAGVAVDVAVLDLGDAPTVPLPRPVGLWPAARMPQRVSVFGFPRAERDATGWWREFHLAGPVGRNLVQLDWAAGVGTLPGQSGGPVLDADIGALVGVLAEGSELGRFDRFVPLPVIAGCWPDLPRPWLMLGSEGRGHFQRRGRGQGTSDRGNDLFRGRAEALAAVRGWLTGEQGSARPLVIIGQPG